MKQHSQVLQDLLDLPTENDPRERLWVAGKPLGVEADARGVVVRLPFRPCSPPYTQFTVDLDAAPTVHALHISALGSEVLRVTLVFDPSNKSMACQRQSEMLVPDTLPTKEVLKVFKTEFGWDVVDAAGMVRVRINTQAAPIKKWSELLPPPYESPEITLFPDGKTPVTLAAHDHFFRKQVDSIALGYITSEGAPVRATFSLESDAQERFAGTGERFAKMDLSGRTFDLENLDGLGVNNRRTYKNVPFYLSSRPYGLFVHTSTAVRLSLADLSTRAAQGVVNEPALDLFLVGGGSVTRVLQNYQSITGKPADVPRFTYGIWMSRMTYFSDEEVTGIAERLRAEDFPCDVLHLDTGWFAKDWVCEWEFSESRFPDPPGFFKKLRDIGYRVTLWQTPNIGEGNRLLEYAKEKRFLAPRKKIEDTSRSDFSAQDFAGQIDFSNPEAVLWYQGMLERLLKMGAVAIKTDFGETIDMWADYASLPADQLRNLYPLLYQRAAFEITQKVTGEGVIWARASWAGAQRYPIHWGGDCACSWEGMAGSLRGGLHLGLSGFAFWSHDVPGFHGVPDFMNSWPSDNLYVRWTQFGVFTSHIRYHGTSPREPYDFPEVADLVRKWWKLRYALIPYIRREGTACVTSGKPVLRPLLVEHERDQTVWHIDDQYYLGDSFLVAPVMNDAGRRDVYLPEGEWVDFWSGEKLSGARWLRDVNSPLDRMPLYVRAGSRVPVYPKAVACTDEMLDSEVVELVFDAGYRGLGSSILGPVTGLS
ncbi:MAG: glycoside hydrolase family 31 protein [Polyangiaceae bacterium]|nr:glycoside hydrolase family 31 protein [Polyangiaceae bacterium]